MRVADPVLGYVGWCYVLVRSGSGTSRHADLTSHRRGYDWRSHNWSAMGVHENDRRIGRILAAHFRTSKHHNRNGYLTPRGVWILSQRDC
jgi:hypothetical protein